MDELIAYCVDEIALDGDQGQYPPLTMSAKCLCLFVIGYLEDICGSQSDGVGTSLERLWTFVKEFQTNKTPQGENIPEIDSKFKGRLWKYLLRHQEVIVRAGDQLLQAAGETTTRRAAAQVLYLTGTYLTTGTLFQG
jgi:hypothetical protein